MSRNTRMSKHAGGMGGLRCRNRCNKLVLIPRLLDDKPDGATDDSKSMEVSRMTQRNSGIPSTPPTVLIVLS
jgi:hypothetical protein